LPAADWREAFGQTIRASLPRLSGSESAAAHPGVFSSVSCLTFRSSLPNYSC